MRDCLIDFWKYCGISVPASATAQEYLLPNALQMPGWKHRADKVIQKCLQRLEFFPKWVDGLRALCAYLRDDDHRRSLIECLEANHLFGLAAMVDRAALVSFSGEWRWHSMARVAKEIEKFIWSLFAQKSTVFDVVRHLEDQSRIRRLMSVFSLWWMSGFKFISWFIVFVDRLQSYGSSCFCHSEEPSSGKVMSC
jgi:hypothetical protein